MTPTNALGLLAVVLVLLVLGISSYDAGRVQRRIATDRARVHLRGAGRPAWRRALHRAVMSRPLGRSVEDRLRRAGHQGLYAGDVVAIALLAAILLVVVLQQLVVTPAAIIVTAAGLLAANAHLDRLVTRRAEAFAEQLPDIARMLSNAASAGMAIPNALALSAREMAEPARTLLAGAVRQMAVGQTLAGAMADLQDRAPSREMAVLVSTLIIQQRSGGDVIEALREMSANLEVRRDLRREVSTVMSGVRFTAYAVMSLGVAMLFVLEVLAGGTLRRMTGSPVGQLLLLVAAGLYVLGGMAVRRLSKVDA